MGEGPVRSGRASLLIVAFRPLRPCPCGRATTGFWVSLAGKNSGANPAQGACEQTDGKVARIRRDRFARGARCGRPPMRTGVSGAVCGLIGHRWPAGTGTPLRAAVSAIAPLDRSVQAGEACTRLPVKPCRTVDAARRKPRRKIDGVCLQSEGRRTPARLRYQLVEDSVSWVTPKVILAPVWLSRLSGFSAMDLSKPPTRALALTPAPSVAPAVTPP